MRLSSLLPIAIGGVAQSCSCFERRTPIATRQGPVEIDRIRVGDWVLSYDVVRRELVERKVLRVFAHGPRALGSLGRLEGVTANHPIFDAMSGDFRRADEFTDGGRLLRCNGESTELLEAERFDGSAARTEPVFNLMIAGTETYFANEILVHNKSFAPNPDHSDFDGTSAPIFNECLLEQGAIAERCGSSLLLGSGRQELYSPEAACKLDPLGFHGAGGMGGDGQMGRGCAPLNPPEMYQVAHLRLPATDDELCRRQTVTFTPISGPVHLEIYAGGAGECSPTDSLQGTHEITERTAITLDRTKVESHFLMVSLNSEPVHIQVEVSSGAF